MNDLTYVAEECSARMEEIASFFKPGVQVTLIVRTPEHDERDFMLTNDNPEELRKLIQRRQLIQRGK